MQNLEWYLADLKSTGKNTIETVEKSLTDMFIRLVRIYPCLVAVASQFFIINAYQKRAPVKGEIRGSPNLDTIFRRLPLRGDVISKSMTFEPYTLNITKVTFKIMSVQYTI